MITINIELKDHNRTKEFFHRLHSKLEDATFTVIQKLPEKFIPHFIMEWLDRYTTKRITELKQQTIKQTWQKMNLEKAVNEISSRQQQ